MLNIPDPGRFLLIPLFHQREYFSGYRIVNIGFFYHLSTCIDFFSLDHQDTKKGSRNGKFRCTGPDKENVF